jgi:hypothetical protein
VDDGDRLDRTATQHRLETEMRELRAAIDLVEVDGAARVSLTGLRFGEQLLRRFRAEALRRGVRLEATWWPEDAGCDLLVVRGGR